MAAPAEVGFSRIVVGMNYGRYGQLLREDLQQKFDLGGEGVSKLYQLETNYRVNVDGIAFDYTLGFATRYRLIATADWSLISLDPDRHTITSGRARQVDGYNPIDNQPFYQDLQNDTTQSRLAWHRTSRSSLRATSPNIRRRRTKHRENRCPAHRRLSRQPRPSPRGAVPRR
jgi:hypothetical protein